MRHLGWVPGCASDASRGRMQGPARSSSLPPRSALCHVGGLHEAPGRNFEARPRTGSERPGIGLPRLSSGDAAVLLDIVNEGTAIGGRLGFDRSDPDGAWSAIGGVVSSGNSLRRHWMAGLRACHAVRRRMENTELGCHSIVADRMMATVLGRARVRSATSSARCELGPPASYRRPAGVPGNRGG